MHVQGYQEDLYVAIICILVCEIYPGKTFLTSWFDWIITASLLNVPNQPTKEAEWIWQDDKKFQNVNFVCNTRLVLVRNAPSMKLSYFEELPSLRVYTA